MSRVSSFVVAFCLGIGVASLFLPVEGMDMSASALRERGLKCKGQGDEFSQSQSIAFFKQAVAQGDKLAEVYLSECYDAGDVERDSSMLPEQYQIESFRVLRRALWDEGMGIFRNDWSMEENADEIRSRALYSLARKYYYAMGTAADLGKARFIMSELNKAEKEKDSKLEYLSLYYLFKMQLEGEGGTANSAIANHILENLKARKESSNNGELSCIIGQCFQLLNNPAEAFASYNEALQGGNPKAHCFIGQCYEFGSGVQVDYLEAQRHYEEGIRSCDSETKAISYCLLANLFEKQGAFGREREILELYVQAANIGLVVEVDFYMGWIYEHGLYTVEKNPIIAQGYYERSLRRGFSAGAYIVWLL